MVSAISHFATALVDKVSSQLQTARGSRFSSIIACSGLAAAHWAAVQLTPRSYRNYTVAGLALTDIALLIFCRRLINIESGSIENVSSCPENLWSELTDKTEVALKDYKYLSLTECRHRFPDIGCFEAGAVPVLVPPRMRPMDTIQPSYLHANLIELPFFERRFFVSQAPLPLDYPWFWTIVYGSESTIIDLTTEVDLNSGGVTAYYPTEHNPEVYYPPIRIKWIKTKENEHTYETAHDYIKDQSRVEVKRFHYSKWKDFEAVSVPILAQLVDRLEFLSPNKKRIIWVHCRAGVGRSGTFITAVFLKEAIFRGKITRESLDRDLIDLIVDLRKQRGPHFVQNKQQFEMLRQYADLCFAEKDKS